jgi:hypothetical protein
LARYPSEKLDFSCKAEFLVKSHDQGIRRRGVSINEQTRYITPRDMVPLKIKSIGHECFSAQRGLNKKVRVLFSHDWHLPRGYGSNLTTVCMEVSGAMDMYTYTTCIYINPNRISSYTSEYRIEKLKGRLKVHLLEVYLSTSIHLVP